jgi:hypothetical protein
MMMGTSCRIGLRIRSEACLDIRYPVVEALLRPRVERRERADDAGRALGNDEVGYRYDKHRRADERNAQLIGEGFG